jgi:hypothetical protein
MFQVWFRFMVFNATFSNISFITWRSVVLVEEAGVPVGLGKYDILGSINHCIHLIKSHQLYIVCVRWCPTHIVLWFFSSSCVPYVASFSGLSMFESFIGILQRLFFDRHLESCLHHFLKY